MARKKRKSDPSKRKRRTTTGKGTPSSSRSNDNLADGLTDVRQRSGAKNNIVPMKRRQKKANEIKPFKRLKNAAANQIKKFKRGGSKAKSAPETAPEPKRGKQIGFGKGSRSTYNRKSKAGAKKKTAAKPKGKGGARRRPTGCKTGNFCKANGGYCIGKNRKCRKG